ncbi:hypothetical protein L204_101033 [Cryptococcus depauperatus]
MTAEAIKSRKPRIEYVIFDMDGLLSMRSRSNVSVDSERIYTIVTNTILGRYGHEMTWDIKSGMMGKPQRLSTQYLLSHFPDVEREMTLEQYTEESDRMKQELFKKVEPMRGAAALVKGLHEAGIPIALATGSNNQNFVHKTTHLPHIFSLFPATSILTADSPEVKRGKPNPDIFLAAAHSLGRDVGTAEECNETQQEERRKGLVFEDATLGVQAGVAAGMNVVWVPDSELRALNPGETYGATEILEHLEEWKPTSWGLPSLSGFN